MKRTNNFQFFNWAGNHTSRPTAYFLPESEEDIIKVILEAAENKKKVRVVGAGHSWSDIACSNDYLVCLDKHSQVLNIDKNKSTITVQAGIRLKQLNRILEENNLALINLGSISEQSIAGAISTGTHGTGINFGNLSTQVIAMKVILADGSVMSIDKETPGNLLSFFLVSLGALGVISEVTIQCTNKFYLEENAAPMHFNKVLQQLPELIRDNHHLKLWWFPHVEEIQVYRYNRTEKNPKPYSAIEDWFNESFMVRFVFIILLALGRRNTKLIPGINSIIKKLHFKNVNRVDISYKIFNVPMPPRHRESEYAFPIEHTAKALKELKQEIEKNRLKINFVVEVRFVKADEIPLSPCYQRDTCYLGAYLYSDDEDWSKYLDVFERLMEKYEGRPHWGKEFSLTQSKQTLLYPKFKEFQAVRLKYDSDKMFTNNFVARVLDNC